MCHFSFDFKAIILEGQNSLCDVTVIPFVELLIKNPIKIEAFGEAVLIAVKTNPSLRAFFEVNPESKTKVGRFQVIQLWSK